MRITQQMLTLLSMSVFALILAAFLVRGFGQFVVGRRTAILLAGPLAVIAGVVLLVVVGIWLISWVGLITVEEDGTD